jgi:hypothetical protein
MVVYTKRYRQPIYIRRMDFDEPAVATLHE